MTFYDADMNTHDVTMQELQLAQQEQYNHSLIGEEPPQSSIWYEMQADAIEEAFEDRIAEYNGENA